MKEFGGVPLVISAVITGQNGTLSQPKIHRYKLSLLPKARSKRYPTFQTLSKI